MPRVIHAGIGGYVTARLGKQLVTAIEHELQARTLVRLFVDLEQLRAFDSEVRAEAARVLEERRASIARMEVLVTSRVVADDVIHVAGGLAVQVHRSRASFEDALRQVDETFIRRDSAASSIPHR